MKQVLLAGKTFNVHQTDAQSQLEVYTLIGAGLAYTVNKSGVKGEINESMLVGYLMSMDLPRLTKVANLLLTKVRVHGEDNTMIDIKMFEGQIMSYYQLIAEAVRLNLTDFFTYILSVEKSAESQQPSA